MQRMEKNITGARKKIVLKGFDVAGFRTRRTWVKDHRRPDSAEAVKTRINPIRTNVVSDSDATIMITPIVIVVIMLTSTQVGFSRRNINANISTKARVEDLHIAVHCEL